jgi:hypothetical protein
MSSADIMPGRRGEGRSAKHPLAADVLVDAALDSAEQARSLSTCRGALVVVGV